VDIGSILSRAWQITSQNRALWLYGFLAALTTGYGVNNSRSEQLSASLGPDLSGPELGALAGIGWAAWPCWSAWPSSWSRWSPAPPS
jgi:hypothetical protein